MQYVTIIKNVVILSDWEEIGDFWRESKDLRTDFTVKIPKVRRSLDSLQKDFAFFRSLGMTAFC